MTQIKIDLSEPFEKVVELVLSTPVNDEAHGLGLAEKLDSDRARCPAPDLTSSADVKTVLRCLYEAAHGRQVETPFGLIPIAPPVAAFLKDEPFYIRTQLDFLLAALTRMIAMSPRADEGPFRQNEAGKRQEPAILNQAHPVKDDRELVTASTYD